MNERLKNLNKILDGLKVVSPGIQVSSISNVTNEKLNDTAILMNDLINKEKSDKKGSKLLQP